MKKIAALLILGMAIAAQALAAAAAPPRPNIIFVLADDLGCGDLGCYGQEKIRTPNLDRLAREGMRFTQHYSGSPVCASSRCTLMTGLHTGHSYIRGNDEWPQGLDVWKDRTLEGQRPLLPGTITVARLLQQSGYRTGLIGKWGLGAAETTGVPDKQGFDYYYGYLCQRQAHNYYPTHLWRNGRKHFLEGNTLGNLHGPHYSHDLMADDCLKFIRENRERPFFLYAAFTIPHVALQVPEDSLQEYIGKFPETPYDGSKGYLPHPTPRAAYAAMITRMDRDIGRMLALLDELGLAQRTLVMFSSDNGPISIVGGSDAVFFRSAGVFRGQKGTLYEGGIRVPMIARWKGRILAGSVSDHVSAFWDFLPTVAEITGMRTPGGIDGVSMVPTLLGRGGQKQHPYLYWEYPEGPGSHAIRMGRWKGIRTGAHKAPEAPVALYDLEDDPAEAKDLAAAQPELARRLEQLMKSARSPSPVPKWNYGAGGDAGSQKPSVAARKPI